MVRPAHEDALRGGHDDGRRDQEQGDHQHDQREALLGQPFPALHVVDPAEGRVERAPERGAEPDARDEGDHAEARGVLADVEQEPGDRPVRGGREEALEVLDRTGLQAVALEHVAAHEQRHEREREERQEQVVGDHPREAGDVVGVALPVEGLDVSPETPPPWDPLAARGRPRGGA